MGYLSIDFTVQSVKHADADGILHAIGNGFNYASVINWKDGVVAFGSDGASVMWADKMEYSRKSKMMFYSFLKCTVWHTD